MTGRDSTVALLPARAGSQVALRRISASQQIYEALRERIVSLELAPGQNLVRAEIAGFYGVSQTPVRDAMMRLEEEGLLVVRPQSRTEVSKIDVAHARETQFLRLSLELEVTRALALVTPPGLLERVRRLIAQQETALATDDLVLFAQLDRQFHSALCDAVGVGNLWQLAISRSGHIDRLRKLNLPEPGKPVNILDHHRQIIECLANGDVEGVEMTIRGHLSGTLAAVDSIIQRHPEYF